MVPSYTSSEVAGHDDDRLNHLAQKSSRTASLTLYRVALQPHLWFRLMIIKISDICNDSIGRDT